MWPSYLQSFSRICKQSADSNNENDSVNEEEWTETY